MIDIHSHIIPGFDDGARDLEESLNMAQMEHSGGTRVMLATPHVQSEIEIDRSEQIVEKVYLLSGEFEARNIDLHVLPGAELFPSTGIAKGLDAKRPITLAGTGKYVLIDLPHSVLPNDFDHILFEIQSRGVVPILAHPERCPVFQQDWRRVLPYVEKGIAFQLNMWSFVGRHGAPAQQCVKKLFDARIAHFLASDAHRVRPRPTGELARELPPEDQSYVELLTKTSGEAVLAGKPLPQLPAPMAKPEKQSWLSRLTRRAG